MMDAAEWKLNFQMKTNKFQEGDSWRLQFDATLVPNSPAAGWQQYIRSTSARFRCCGCGRRWPSNHVMVVFHMRLAGGHGVVRVRALRQNCKMCSSAAMAQPNVTSENIDILLEHLVEKIRMKCYHEDLGRQGRPPESLEVQNPHEPEHCEGCQLGICTGR
ncbi:receptor-transporting protein 2-like [Clinocottus analis]|uniref:receptor-transporting protein 2-like n=1 Tax=Clinocottus analis TaxID=304258 RepID=UPI0035C04071